MSSQTCRSRFSNPPASNSESARIPWRAQLLLLHGGANIPPFFQTNPRTLVFSIAALRVEPDTPDDEHDPVKSILQNEPKRSSIFKQAHHRWQTSNAMAPDFTIRVHSWPIRSYSEEANADQPARLPNEPKVEANKIGRASCRERVEISDDAGA